MSSSFDREWDAPECESVAMLAQGVVIQVPGCADIEVRKVLQSAYSDFCRLSSCYTRRRDIALESGRCRYPVPAAMPECFVDSVTDVRLDSRRLVGGRDYAIETGDIVALVLDDRIVPDGPSPWRTLAVTAIDIPRPGSEKAPRWFLRKYGEAVAAGALVRLFGMTGKPWSDSGRAQQELVRWENYLTDTRLRAVCSGDRSGSGGGALSALDTSGLL